jgi:hypothetical protein
MKLDETPFTFMVDQTPGMYAEPGDVTEGPGDGSVRHDPTHHSSGSFVKAHKVPSVVVSGLGLRDFTHGVGFDSVD